MMSEGTNSSICNVPVVERGPKPVISGKRAAVSTDHPGVTDVIMRVLRAGGNAADAVIAGAMAQAAIEPYMTNHAGTITALYWDDSTRQAHQLNAMGTLVPRLPPFRPVPPVGGFSLPGFEPQACIPGFIPGLAALHERFGTFAWSDLCQDAIAWAEEGHVVSSFEHEVNALQYAFFGYFPEGRKLWAPDGFLVAVGERFRNPSLAETLRRTAAEGPAYFTEGGWAEAFIATANRLGWRIEPTDMTAHPPRWQEPLKYRVGDFELIQMAPPERQGAYCAMVLGILGHLGYSAMDPDSAEALYSMAHVLRWAERELCYLHDPVAFDVPLDVWLDDSYHQKIARIIAGSRPKVDLTAHVERLAGPAAMAAAGALHEARQQPVGTCEISVVDEQGNWAQLLSTLQGGGIPAMVVGGVPMVGSHAAIGKLGGGIQGISLNGWLLENVRIRSVSGCTFVMREGEPVLSMGTPGRPDSTVPQMLANILYRGMEPYAASERPRMLPLYDDLTLTIESRVPASSIAGLASMGIRVKSSPAYDWHMGSFQMCWRDEESGLLSTCADPRRCGVADGID